VTAAGQPILVVIGDENLRRLVGWALAEWDLSAHLVISWPDALVTTSGPPACIIADLDDIGVNADGGAVLRKGWGGTVSLVVLGQQPDVDERATPLGAVAGQRTPLNVGDLMRTVRGLVLLRD
jgi:hypothetical protein